MSYKTVLSMKINNSSNRSPEETIEKEYLTAKLKEYLSSTLNLYGLGGKNNEELLLTSLINDFFECSSTSQIEAFLRENSDCLEHDYIFDYDEFDNIMLKEAL